MRTRRQFRLMASSAIASLCVISSARAAEWGFNDLNGGGANSTSITHFAEQVTVGGPSPATIQGMIIGLNFLAVPSSPQMMDIQIWTGANLSSGTSNALAGATLIDDSTPFALFNPVGTGASDEVLSYGSTPVVVPGNTFTVVFSLLNSTGTAPSTEVGGIFNDLTPVAGSSPGFVWTDTNSDGIFQGTEQSSSIGGGSIANIDLIVSVPEPASASLLITGAAFGLTRRRRRA